MSQKNEQMDKEKRNEKEGQARKKYLKGNISVRVLMLL